MIYGISDFFAILLRYIIPYRKKIILKNLKNSFPDKSERELKKLLFPIYRNIADLLVETIKGFSMSSKQVQKHITTINIEVMHELYDKYNGIIGVLGHYGNWEWAALLAGLSLKQKSVVLYKPLSNKYLDNYIHQNRSRFGVHLCSIYITAKSFEENKNKKMFFAMVADQSPSNVSKAYWTTFLNQPTACLHGPEKYAKMFDMPVVYIFIDKVKRGYYEITFRTITEHPKTLPDGELTHQYFNILEKDIIAKPAPWLWSHRRWKHTPKSNLQL
jgi:KDO2-lipid IV(A) lauroyltransferase